MRRTPYQTTSNGVWSGHRESRSFIDTFNAVTVVPLLTVVVDISQQYSSDSLCGLRLNITVETAVNRQWFSSTPANATAAAAWCCVALRLQSPRQPARQRWFAATMSQQNREKYQNSGSHSLPLILFVRMFVVRCVFVAYSLYWFVSCDWRSL